MIKYKIYKILKKVIGGKGLTKYSSINLMKNILVAFSIASELGITFKEFNKDILHWKNYDYVVINDDLQRCFNEISELINSFVNKSKNNYDKKLIEKHISKLTS